MATSKDELLEEFKAKIESHLKPDFFLHQDFYLKKWLIARDYNIVKAEKMFVNNVEFRKKNGVDDILTNFEPSEILKKYTTGGLIGHDKDGNVLRVELFGRLDMRGIMYTSKKSDIEKMKILECENVVSLWQTWNEQHPEKPSDGMTVIFDMEGVTSRVMWRPGLTMYLHLIQILEDNYPEMLKRLLIVNSPSIFPFLWTICKPLVSEHTKKKIQILGSNYNVQLLKYIDPEVLPKHYGGEKTDLDGDHMCKSLICQGGIIEPERYSSNKHTIHDAIHIQINSGSQHFIKKYIKRAGSILRWEFKTNNYDLGFGINFYSEDEDKEAILPIHRVNCHMVPEDGSHLCEKIGTYEIAFDNSYSLTRSKSAEVFFELIDLDDSFKSEISIF